MTQHLATTQSLIVTGIFLFFYIGFLLRKAINGRLDLYDLIFLSAVAVLPAAFLFFPGLALAVSQLLGVAFPFVALFSILFALIFIFMHRLTVQNDLLQQRTRVLVQEIGLLQQKLGQAASPRAGNSTVRRA